MAIVLGQKVRVARWLLAEHNCVGMVGKAAIIRATGSNIMLVGIEVEGDPELHWFSEGELEAL
jgi:hypothetical protein